MRKKLEHILTYEKGKIFLIVLLSALLLLIAVSYGRKEKEILLSGILINQYPEQETIERLEEDMLRAAEGDADTCRVELDCSVTLNLKAQDQDTMDNLAKITAWIFGKDLDFMIGEPDVAEHFAALNGLADLTEIFGEDLPKPCRDRIFYSEEGKAVGICLENTALIKRYGIELENPVFCLVNNSEHRKLAAEMIIRLMEEGIENGETV